MDCAFCYYPNEDDTRFCVRCAAALGVAEDRLPSEAPPAPNGLIADGTQGPGGGAVDPHLLGDRYRIVRCLGTGGFGSVYEAEEVDSGLRVAVKVLHHTALVDARMRERFLQEARMIAKLRSPHVVRLYDFAVTPAAAASDAQGARRPSGPGGQPYLVMELLQGKNLAALLMQGVLSPRRTLHILAQVCAALGEAHALGIVHRDIKPDNILLVPHGRLTGGGDGTNVRDGSADFVKVVDFGVARWSGPITRPSDVLGTPAFISPETLANEPVDGRSDLYSVGMLLWQMMLGDLPFPAKNQAVMMNSHLSAPRRRPSEVLPQLGRRLPAALETLMVRLIARQPVDRPASAYEVHADLMALLPRVPDVPFEDMALPNFGPCWDGPLDPPEPAVNPAAHSPHGHAPDARAGTADDRRATRRQHVTSPPAAALRSGAASKATRRLYSRLQRFFGVGRGSPHEKSP